MARVRRIKKMDEQIGNFDIKSIRRLNRDLYWLYDIMNILKITLKDVKTVVPKEEIFKYEGQLFIKDLYLRALILKYGNEEYNDYREKVAYRDFDYNVHGFTIDPELEIVEKINIGDLELYRTEEYLDFTDFDLNTKEFVDWNEFSNDITDEDLENLNKYLYEN